MIGRVFCDFLTVTMPKDEWLSAKEDLEVVLDEVSCVKQRDDGPDRSSCYYQSPDGGSVKTGSRSGIVWVQATGRFFTALRDMRLLNNYLMIFGSRPHRVTRLDASLDLPDESSSILNRLYDAAKLGDVSLSRKGISHTQITRYVEPSLYGGSDTGTLYLGRTTAEVGLVIYDKRQEILKFTGKDIGHYLTRYECRIRGKMGPSLRDVANPAPIFYHFMSPSVLAKPTGVDDWFSYDGGYNLPKRESLPYQTLKRRIESSPELARLVHLASACGPTGVDLLVAQIRKLAGVSTHPLGCVLSS